MKRADFQYIAASVALLVSLPCSNAAADQKPLTILGSDAAACASDSTETAVLVHVRGLRDAKGKVRLELYSDQPDDFLKSGYQLQQDHHVFRRIDVPTPAGGRADICMQLPGPGRYSMAVLHDRNNDGKLNIMSDGFGFPGNPKLSWSKPKVEKALFAVSGGVGHMDIVLNYVMGLSVKPVGGKH